VWSEFVRRRCRVGSHVARVAGRSEGRREFFDCMAARGPEWDSIDGWAETKGYKRLADDRREKMMEIRRAKPEATRHRWRLKPAKERVRSRVVSRHPGSMIARFDRGGQRRFTRCQKLAHIGRSGPQANWSAYWGSAAFSGTPAVNGEGTSPGHSSFGIKCIELTIRTRSGADEHLRLALSQSPQVNPDRANPRSVCIPCETAQQD
jgi:hypothetical protein